jgi:hypothetical protein
MTDAHAELKARRRREPFDPFVIILTDGRRFQVDRRFQFAFTESQVVVLDERDRNTFFKTSDIARIETLHPVG